ncbi:23S rRNA (uracil1939-C5)-methyltransferase [Mesorhizobium sp. J18]|uniref:class I SAM-dependent RNA methyltransferase n=1 Tax=Mesorhizobium sp. J18 TaxID=935263 RepID=UPI00119A9D44|nr:class I SAM-dependent RNA methyltransferase [Mesorhizobium sp. J18]TWG89643.1 23S rRNA (uracil1939-C5)-methyltransferase [Mesorhizobium sp. J18]
MTATLRIERLGAQGDGVADTPKGPVFVPFTLPGERVRASIGKNRADLLAIEEASPLRTDPACRHFGTCGGCAVQHLEEGTYRTWKRERVITALNNRGIAVEVDPLVPCLPASRRRMTFAARRTEGGILLGFNQALSHRIVDIEECPIAVPEIVVRLEELRRLAGLVCNTSDSFRLTVTATASGLDAAFEESGKISEKARRAASDFTIRHGFARLSVAGEIVVEPKKPMIRFGDASVTPPPGGFLQAVESAEDAMAGFAVAHLANAKKVLDLFAGSGAFALRLARDSEVHAVEGDAAALAALDRGFRFAAGLKRVTTERRDLFRRPFTFKELDAFGGLVFDPPRAGAEEQSKQIARSSVPLVAAISCNPTTLARDLAILIAGGYVLRRVVPIDQFLWSPHVEAVALLEKPRKRR